MFKGHVTGIVRNAKTLEVEGGFENTNVITQQLFKDMLTNYPASLGILASTHRYSPSRFTTTVYAGLAYGAETVSVGTPIPGKNEVQFFDRTEDTEAFIQFSTRLGVPTANRNINMVGLGQTDSASSPIRNGGTIVVDAYTKLDSPCSQTTSQVLDIYYRIYFPISYKVDKTIAQYLEVCQAAVGKRIKMYDGNDVCTSLPVPVLKEENKTLGAFGFDPLPTTVRDPNSYKFKSPLEMALTQYAGYVFAQLGYKNSAAVLIDTYRPAGSIQNVIGHAPTGKGPMLDVDALPSGTGLVSAAGSWTNKAAPEQAGKFYDGYFPEMRIVDIVSSGAVGISTYTYRTRTFLGTGNADLSAADNRNTFRGGAIRLPFLYGTTGRLTLEDKANFNAQQMSAMLPYGRGSIAFPTKSKLYVYNIAAGEYWVFTNSFTAAHQIAIIGDDIYVACANTGLWRINPRTESAMTNIVPSVGDLSRCYGVAVGYNNSLWIVATDGLLKFSAGVWTKFDSANGFAFVGISDGNWSNIAYLNVDANSSTNAMMLVRKPDASADSGKLCVWWSEATAPVNGPSETTGGTSNSGGRPRTNKKHTLASGEANVWMYVSLGNLYFINFGQSAVSKTIALGADVSSFALNLVNNGAGEKRLFMSNGNSGYQSEAVARTITLYKFDGTVEYTCSGNASSCVTSNSYREDVGGNPAANSSAVPLLGNSDCYTDVMLEGGLLLCIRRSGTNTASAMPVDGLSATLSNICFTTAKEGGTLKHLGEKAYGWDGSSWQVGLTTGKPTHASPQAMHDQVTLSFAEGQTGTSYVVNDFYTFALCAGLFKDNATTASLNYSAYFKKAFKNSTELEMPTVPASRAGSTGLMGLSVQKSNPGISINGSNQFVFADKNHDQQAVGNIELVGDFDISFAVQNNTSMRNVLFGIITPSNNYFSAAYYIDSAGAITAGYRISKVGSFAWTNHLLLPTDKVIGNVSAIMSLGLRRVGANIYFVVNGVANVWNSSTGSSSDFPLGLTRCSVVCSPIWIPDAAYLNSNQVAPAITVNSNGTDNAVKLGSAAAKTGAFNPNFYVVDVDSVAASVTIGGVPAPILTSGDAPAAGSVALDIWNGYMTFHPDDAGKALTAALTYLTHD